MLRRFSAGYIYAPHKASAHLGATSQRLGQPAPRTLHSLRVRALPPGLRPSEDPARTLTDLYVNAAYGPGPVPPADRDTALAALAMVKTGRAGSNLGEREALERPRRVAAPQRLGDRLAVRGEHVVGVEPHRLTAVALPQRQGESEPEMAGSGRAGSARASRGDPPDGVATSSATSSAPRRSVIPTGLRNPEAKMRWVPVAASTSVEAPPAGAGSPPQPIPLLFIS